METDPIEQRLGNYSIMMDVNEAGDLQIRVYPLMDDGQPWDAPVSVFDVTSAECAIDQEEGEEE